MAENIVINGETYNAVESVELNTTEGKKVLFFQGQPVTVAQETGSDEAAVMSQKAVTAEVERLSNEKVDQIPAGVKAEASGLVDKTLSRNDTKVFRFLAVADAHHKTDDDLITAGTIELGQGVGEVLRMIGVDFVANLGDICWGASTSDVATVLEEGKVFNTHFLDSVRGQTQLWIEGNHETYWLSESQIRGLIYTHSTGLVQDTEHWMDGYGYLDFPIQKVRVICLNTNQETTLDNVSGMSDEQVKWFSEVALNMDGKTDWNVITIGHHPLSYNTVSLMRYAAETVKSFVNGENFSCTTNNGTTIAINYSDKNCQYVGHFHGHAHSFSVLKMQHYVSPGVYEEFDAWEICIPNACYERNNQYKGSAYEGQYSQRYTTDVTYNKSNVDGKRTSFNLITVCLDKKVIYADNFGAGVDREVDYTFKAAYVNQIPISTDMDGSIYNGIGYKPDTYLSGGNPGSRTGVETTGFIPLDDSGECVIYLSGITATATDGNFRMALYDGEKGYIVQIGSNQLDNNVYATVPYELGADGNIVKLDYSGVVEAIKTKTGRIPAFYRMCSSNIDGNSILTVNEPIE